MLSAEQQKHDDNDPRCLEEGWLCLPLAVDSYGRWGPVAHRSFETIAEKLAVRTRVSFDSALSSLYNSLALILVRQNARAILARLVSPSALGAREVRLLAAARS